MNRIALLAVLPLMIGAPAAAQTMNHMPMTGMSMTMPTRAAKVAHAKKRVHAQPSRHRGRAARHAAPTMPGMPMPAAPASGEQPSPAPTTSSEAKMTGMPGMEMSSAGHGQAPAGHDTAAMPDAGEPDIPHTPPPPPSPIDHAADRYYDPAAMAAARATLRREHGGAALSQVMANLAEYQTGRSGGGYRWEGQAWFGGDINRLAFTSEGDGSRSLDSAELQALYSRAVTPYFNVQAGVRQDFAPRGRTYATVGVQGLAPYWFDVQGALFLSTEGELLGRLQGSYDLRLGQRLILQPRAELNFAALGSADTRTGSGLSNAEIGLRLRYEISRAFAPYVGFSYDRKFGKTADFARVRGEDPGGASFVAGIRAWF